MSNRDKALDFSINLLTNLAYDKMVNQHEFDKEDAQYVLGQATRVVDKALGDKSTPNIKRVVRQVNRRVERRVDRRVDR
ncbi:hypothetical protein [Bacillus cereus group sp. Bce018]|uniref:hypothetical protein n=1 Tax=Bacillus cereus group sp. Bce018 TaxID=3445248 RepID=UPI003F1F466F